MYVYKEKLFKKKSKRQKKYVNLSGFVKQTTPTNQ
jgi:hypothetical protein